MRAENEFFAEDFETKTVNDVPVLFTPLRIDRRLIPENVFAYDIRESDDGDMLATNRTGCSGKSCRHHSLP